MNRKQACLNQAELCLERAAADVKGRDYWTKEAERWQKAALASKIFKNRL